MKIPTDIRLGPHVYEIRSDADTARLLRDEGTSGDSRPDQHVIRVDTDRPHTGLAETLLHDQTDLRVDYEETEEKAVTALAPLLLQLLRLNPDLVAFLTLEAK